MKRSPRTSHVIEVAAGLVFRNGQLLIAQRRLHDHLGGLWEFPGGKREGNETFAACLTRELKEELGIAVEVGELFDDVTHAYPERTVRIRFFRCRWLKHEPQAIACRAFAWVTRKQIGQFEFPAADAQLLNKLKAQNRLWGA